MTFVRWFLILLAVAILPAVIPSARADEAGANLIYNEDHRAVSPDYPGSIGLDILRLRKLAFWERTWDERQKTTVVLEKERYTLQSGANREYFSLNLTKLHPRHVVRRELWALDAGLVSLTMDRPRIFYSPAPGDERSRFYLPALVADYTPEPLRLRAGAWLEYDVLPMDFQTYSLVLNSNKMVSMGYAPEKDMEARITVVNVERVYPTGFNLPRRDMQLELRLTGLAGEVDSPASIRSLEGTFTVKRYPLDGTSQRELMVKGVARLSHGRYTHFLVPILQASSMFTVYRLGLTPESLRETQQPQPNITIQLEYEGFTRLEQLPLVLAWGGAWREPLLREVRRQRVANVKITWVY